MISTREVEDSIKEVEDSTREVDNTKGVEDGTKVEVEAEVEEICCLDSSVASLAGEYQYCAR